MENYDLNRFRYCSQFRASKRIRRDYAMKKHVNFRDLMILSGDPARGVEISHDPEQFKRRIWDKIEIDETTEEDDG